MRRPFYLVLALSFEPIEASARALARRGRNEY